MKTAEEILNKHWQCDTYPVWEGGEIVRYLHEYKCNKCRYEKQVLDAINQAREEAIEAAAQKFEDEIYSYYGGQNILGLKQKILSLINELK